MPTFSGWRRISKKAHIDITMLWLEYVDRPLAFSPAGRDRV